MHVVSAPFKDLENRRGASGELLNGSQDGVARPWRASGAEERLAITPLDGMSVRASGGRRDREFWQGRN